PKKDPAFDKAVKENRVLTIEQSASTKHKDFGRIGFHEGEHSVYLVFPRSLPGNDDARVVGINYQLLEEPKPADLVRPKKPEKRQASRKPKLPKPAPKTKRFTVTVRRTATEEATFEVEAESREAAEQQVRKLAEAEPWDVKKAGLSIEVTGVHST